VPGQGRRIAAAITVVLVVAGLVLFALLRGGQPSDEQAIREWLGSPAGGAAPPDATQAIHVPACNLTGYRSGSQDVLSCELEGPEQSSLGGPSSELRGCFVISNGKVLRGGRQVKAIADCKALRYDGRTHGLIDVETGRHYPIGAT
jgi:hypothetical protein